MAIIESTSSKGDGSIWNFRYEELDSFDSVRELPVGAAGALCFCGDQIVLAYEEKIDKWVMPGGGREEGETFEECVTREIKEESNMKVLELFPLGCETYTNQATGQSDYVLRYVAKVEPYGPFVADPAGGEVTSIKLIDPKDYKQYFDWKERGDLLMTKAVKITQAFQAKH